jgi:hypothetical protein
MPNAWLGSFASQVTEESRLRRPGADSILTRLAEVMFIDVLRRYLEELPGRQDRAEALDFEKIMTAWTEAVERVDAGLAGLTPDMVDGPAAESPTGRRRCCGGSRGRKVRSASGDKDCRSESDE